MKFLLIISFLLSFVVFSQSNSLQTVVDSIPPKRIEIKPYGCEAVDAKEIPQREKDSLFNLYKISMLPVIEDSLSENEERITNTVYVEMINPIIFYPEYPGGPKAMKDFIDSSFIYPVNEPLRVGGTIYVRFVIDTLGNLDSFKVMKGLTPLVDKEALRVVKSFPKFTPYIFCGKKQSISYDVPIKVNFFYVEPEFIGGNEELVRYIQDNLIYQKLKRRDSRVEGTAYVTFKIEKDGTISNVKVIKGVSEYYDTEIKRLIESMPKWKPAELNGEKINTSQTIPIKIQ